VSQRTKVVVLVSLLLLSACARSGTPMPTPEPTRTPKPTFTPTVDRPTLVAMNTDTPVQTAPPTDTPVPAAETPTSGAYPAPSTAVPTGTGLPTETPVPTDTPVPTATSLPTNTPVPTATSVPCPEGYDFHVHESLGFSACYPRDWVISEEEESEQGTRLVNFMSPTSDRSTGAGLKFISVAVGPNPTDASGEDFLKAMATTMIQRYQQALAGWPHSIQVDEQAGVEAKFQIALPFPTEVVDVVGWEGVFLVDNQAWTMVVLGRNEYADELQGIHDEFLANFHVLPR
jgi:hypothetical protein